MSEPATAPPAAWQTEERYQLLVEQAVDYAIFMLDTEGHVASWNSGAQRIKGYRADEILGKHFSCFFTAEAKQDGRPQFLLDEARKQGRVEDENWRVRKDGSKYWANVVLTVLRDRAGELIGFFKVTRDLTARKREEEAFRESLRAEQRSMQLAQANEVLRDSEERMRSVVNHVIDGIITIDEHGMIDSLNPAAEKIFGYRAGEVIGQNVRILMPEPYHSEHDSYLANYLFTGQARIIGIGREVVGRRKDGSTFPMDLAVSEFRFRQRRYFTGIVRDITERKRLEEELRQRLHELAAADRHKNEFLAMLAHELRNPLAPVRNALHLLKIAGGNPEIQQQTTEMMERQVEHLVRLVDDLLDVSRIVRGKIDLRKEQLDLATIISRAVETAQPALDAQGHELTISLFPRPIQVEGDLIRLTQVIGNLLTNAAKYTTQAGRIWLSTDRILNEAIISVRDPGIGIPQELQPRIFELFVQADQSLARSQGGLGIGLTLAKRLVEMHGGSISVHSLGEGQGSEFTVRLPALPEMSLNDARTAPAIKAAQGLSHRVLVVDDNVDAAVSAALLLKAWGHEVKTVHDGLSALQAMDAFQPQIVLLDIGLPKMNGYEVARRLRANADHKNLVLAAMTGYGQIDDRRKSLEAGFNYHLTKPLDPRTLKTFLELPHALLSTRQ